MPMQDPIAHRRLRHRRPPHARLWPALRSRPRLLGAMVFGLVVYAVLVRLLGLAPVASALVAWNASAISFLVVTGHMMVTTDLAMIRRRAVTQDEGRIAILSLVVLAAVAMLVAVASELVHARAMEGSERVLHIGLAALTVMTSWFFTQVLFALHYAHDFYAARAYGEPDPLAFPGTPDPVYSDFLHFAVVLGATAQTADITFQGGLLRPVGTLHSLMAFVFNASLVGLSVNVAAGLV